MLHDILIGKLFEIDFEKFLAISRAETLVAKIHGHVAVLPPLHLFYSSNQRLMTHSVQWPTLFALLASAQGNRQKSKEGSKEKRSSPFAPPKAVTAVKTTLQVMHSQVMHSQMLESL